MDFFPTEFIVRQGKNSYVQGWPLFKAGLLQYSQHSRRVLQQLKSEERNFISLSLNLSNWGGNMRNFLKQSWGSSKSDEELREGGVRFVSVSFQQQLLLHGDTSACVNTVLKWDWTRAKLSWTLLCRPLLRGIPQLLPIPPSLCSPLGFFQTEDPVHSAGLCTETSIDVQIAQHHLCEELQNQSTGPGSDKSDPTHKIKAVGASLVPGAFCLPPLKSPSSCLEKQPECHLDSLPILF